MFTADFKPMFMGPECFGSISEHYRKKKLFFDDKHYNSLTGIDQFYNSLDFQII